MSTANSITIPGGATGAVVTVGSVSTVLGWDKNATAINVAFSGGTATAAATKPDAAHTGPTNRAILKPSGTLTITTPNAVVQNLAIAGTVYVQAPGVTITNCTIDATGHAYGVQVVNQTGGKNSVTVQDTEITNASAGAVFGNNWTCQRLHVHELGADAFDGGGNNLLESCYIHNIGKTPAGTPSSQYPHADGFQANNGTNIIIRNNNFDIPWFTTGTNGVVYHVNSCIFLNDEIATAQYLNGTQITGNWFNGGNYCIYALNQTNTSVTNNVFPAAAGKNSSTQFGVLDNPTSQGCPKVATWSGNVDTNGKAVQA